MKIEMKCPGNVLEIFTPPGHEKVIIQVQGKLPNDGIPLGCIKELAGLLQRYVEEIFKEPAKWFENPYEKAANAMKGSGEEFTPALMPGTDRFAYFVLAVDTCANCGTVMTNGHFPIYNKLTLNAQLERAGWRLRSGIEADVPYGELCQVCADAGVARFKCALCGEERTSNEIKEQYGDPSEYLCTVCYETRTAKEWEEAEERLYAAHRYDYE
jgi:hypothetical protein